jgi:hypothetical protein
MPSPSLRLRAGLRWGRRPATFAVSPLLPLRSAAGGRRRAPPAPRRGGPHSIKYPHHLLGPVPDVMLDGVRLTCYPRRCAVSPSATRRRPVRGARARLREALPGGTCDGRGPCRAPWRDAPEHRSESLPLWKRGLPMGRNEVSVLSAALCLSRAGSLRVAPRRSASRLAAAGPGGPRLARRRASRPRWSRTPGGRGDAGHVTSAPRFTRWALGGPVAGTVLSRCQDDGGMLRSCAVQAPGRGRFVLSSATA